MSILAGLSMAFPAFAQTDLGILYTAEELAIWAQRSNGANAVNYKSTGADNTPGDFDRIKGFADDFLANPSASVWQGSATQGANYPVYQGINLQQAAFCYKIYQKSNPTLAAQYASTVRTYLLRQIATPNTDISKWNPNTVGENGVFESKWITRLVFATDYLSDYLSASDKTTLNAWFLNQANFMANQIQSGAIGQCFPNRLSNDYSLQAKDAKPGGESYGIYIPGAYPDGYEYTHANADGSYGNKISWLATRWNNRNADKVTMIGMVGHLVNNSSLIFQAKQYAKEWIKYSVYPDGTMGEYERNGDYGIAQQGLIYGAINMSQFILLAEATARRGDFELYNYTTSEGLQGTAGGTKSIRLVCEKYCKNIQGSPAIYYRKPYARYMLDGYSDSTQSDLMMDVLLAIPNKYWQSNYITSIYTRTAPNVRPYPPTGSAIVSAGPVWFPWGGTGAEQPGLLFMFGQMETAVRTYTTTATVDLPGNLRVPYVLQRSTQFTWDPAVGSLSYNLRYRPLNATSWTTISVLNTFQPITTLTAGTTYEWQVQAVGNSGTSAFSSSAFFTTPAACTGVSSVARQQWNNQTGYYIWQTTLLPLGTSPSSSSNISTLEKNNSGQTNYFTQTRGYICVPTTGNYTFWVSGDDEAELWLSTDDDPVDAVKIASCKWTNFREFSKYSTQKSASIPLIGNQRYYIEVRQTQVTGLDHFSVQWQLPDGTIESPVSGTRISPYVPNQLPTASITADKSSYTAGDNVVLTATASDADGSINRVDFYSGSTLIGTDYYPPFTYTYASVPTGSYTFKTVAVDNTNSAGNPASVSVTVANGTVVTGTAPASVCPTGSITRELWTGITGSALALVPVQSPTSSTTITNGFEAPANAADAYAQRIRGYICPPVTGDYTFWIAGDDQAELWLSSSEDTTAKVRICFTTAWTNSREYTKYASQKSGLVTLTAGYRYYIEASQKENVGGDNLSVAWTIPGGFYEAPIPANRLSPWTGVISYTCKSSGTITRETFNNVTSDISAINWTATPWWRGTNGSLDAPKNAGDNFAQRLYGYICPPASGVYTFQISGDEQTELWLSTDETQANAVKIAYNSSATLYKEFTKFATQTATVWLSQGRRYYIEAREKDVTGNDFLTVAWTIPGGVVESPIPGSRLATFASGAARQGQQEGFLGNSKEPLKLTLYPNPAEHNITLQASDFAGTEWQIRVISQVGTEVKRMSRSFTPDQFQTEISVDDLAPGLYIVRVQDGLGAMHNLRFTKQ